MDTPKEVRFATPGENIVDPNKAKDINYDGRSREKGVKRIKQSISKSIENKFPNTKNSHERYGAGTKKSLLEMIISGEATPTFHVGKSNTDEGKKNLAVALKMQEENNKINKDPRKIDREAHNFTRSDFR